MSDSELRETQTANYFSDIYPIDSAVLSANAQSAQNAARCCRYCFLSEMQKAMDPVMRPTAHMKHLVFPLPVGQDRKMDQASGNSHRIHLAHQGANPFFIPEDIGEIGEPAPYIVVGDT